jgi:protein involved in polysaccharide export with SLBB domain
MTMRDLILLAGGLLESASLQSAEIARLPADRTNGVTARTMRVPLDSSYIFDRGPDGSYVGPPGLPASAGPTPETLLQPYDNVLIFVQPDWKYLRTAFITGEVRYPGRYTIQNKSERLSDLIIRAGGLTKEANADGAYFSRRRSATTYQGLIDSVRLRGDSSSRVGVDLAAVVHNPNDIDNLILENGDSLDIPDHRATVEIRGAVNAPTTVALSPGDKLEHYIHAAGGSSRIAESKSAYVIQPNGKIETRHRVAFIFRADPTPRAGATVIVPVRDTTNTGAVTLQSVSIITGIIATLITAYALIHK